MEYKGMAKCVAPACCPAGQVGSDATVAAQTSASRVSGVPLHEAVSPGKKARERRKGEERDRKRARVFRDASPPQEASLLRVHQERNERLQACHHHTRQHLRWAVLQRYRAEAGRRGRGVHFGQKGDEGPVDAGQVSAVVVEALSKGHAVRSELAPGRQACMRRPDRTHQGPAQSQLNLRMVSKLNHT